ncbi:prepilin-type N-terminal cleavage/methylation domain-containing protein [Clostridium subterminale]|uniref:Type II secretion system protein n=1 Tax=Clostridium subterminale TaxID=1550 RepID=A0ABN1KG85_CLOSU
MNKKNSKAKKKGFTLIELLVVLGIIGVLALAVAPTMVSKVDEAKEKTDVSNANSIAVAVKTEIIEGDINASGPIEESDITEIANDYFDGKLPTPQSQGGTFVITVTDNIITVKAGEKEFYPNYVAEDKKDSTETAGN